MKRLLLLSFLVSAIACQQETETLKIKDFQVFVENFNSSNDASDIPDLSVAYYTTELKRISKQLEELNAIDTTQLSFEDRIDWRFAHSILKGKEIRQSEHRTWKIDPRNYMTFRTLGNIIEKPGAITDKVTQLEARLKMVPVQLQNGQNQLEFYVPRFQELSLFMAENAKSLFEKDLMEFASNSEGGKKLIPLITKCQEALVGYTYFVANELPQKPQQDFAMGKETYNRILEQQFLLDHTDETLWEFGKAQFDKTVSELEALAIEIDPQKTWQELATEIKNDYPEPHEMIAAHQLWVDSSKAHILKKNLIPIPWEEQVRVVPRAEYLRKTSYYGNFSRAQGKDKDSILTAQWMINPFEDQWDDQTKQEYLEEHDWGVIIVTAPHEAYGGHHVQGLYQMHNPSKLRRENGLSMFSEGWGLYNEQLMSETGFFPSKEIHLRQLQLRLWRNARVVYDVGMHTGKMSYEEAITMMTDKVGFLRWAAQLEVDSASERPGYFIGYFMGMSEILKMRTRYQKRMGDRFTLSDFHEKLLKIGNMPPKLIEASLFRND
jgi:uncharacterized protein (DUF885 family)